MKYALDGVKSYISAQLEATLLLIEAEWTATIERWKYLDVTESKTLQFPMIEILPSDTTPEYGSDESPLTEHWAYHSIDLEVSALGQESAAIQTTLLGYCEAFNRIIEGSMTFGGVFNRVRLGRAQYSPLMTTDAEKKLLKILRQNIVVRVLRS
jgi:hypothetical protein